MQVVLVYLKPFRSNFTLKMCVAAQNREKITKNSYVKGSRSFKVIDLDINRKNV